MAGALTIIVGPDIRWAFTGPLVLWLNDGPLINWKRNIVRKISREVVELDARKA